MKATHNTNLIMSIALQALDSRIFGENGIVAHIKKWLHLSASKEVRTLHGPQREQSKRGL